MIYYQIILSIESVYNITTEDKWVSLVNTNDCRFTSTQVSSVKYAFVPLVVGRDTVFYDFSSILLDRSIIPL